MNINPTLFNWKKDQLYYGNKKTGIQIIPDTSFPEMWWIVTPTGNSHDFYNRAWAKQHAIVFAREDL